MATDKKPANAVCDGAAARLPQDPGNRDHQDARERALGKGNAVIPSAANVLKALRVAGLALDDQVVRSTLAGIEETWAWTGIVTLCLPLPER